MAEGTFRLPRGVFVTPHIVHSDDDWPAPVAGIGKALREAQARVNIESPSRELERVIGVALEDGYRPMHDRLRVEANLSYLGPESKCVVLDPLVGKIVKAFLPDASINLGTRYARAVHPCYSGVSAVRVLPGVGAATSVVTLPVQMYEIPSTTSTTNPAEDAANAPSSGVSMTSAKPSSDQGSHMRNSSGPAAQISRASVSASEGLYSDGEWVGPEHKLHPFSHAHLLLPHRAHGHIPFPIVCVAPHSEIYEVLSSALFQRQLFGVDAPVLGFTFDPVACHLQAVIAWLSPSDLDGHACTEVHVAHAASYTSRLAPCQDTRYTSVYPGVFDISQIAGASSLAAFLVYCQSEFIESSVVAQKTTPLTRTALLCSEVKPWRVNLVLEDESCENPTMFSHNFIERWLSFARDGEAGDSSSTAMSSMQKLNQPRDGQKTKVLRSDEKSVEDSRSLLCCIVEQGVDAAAAEDIQEKLIGPKDKVFHHFMKRKYYGASVCAQPTKNGPDLPNEIQKDRLTTSAVWPNAMHLIPDSWPHRVRFQEIQELQLRLGGIKRMTWNTHEIHGRYLQALDDAETPMAPHGEPSDSDRGKTDEPSVIHLGPIETRLQIELDENDSTALHEFREELQVEQAMRVLNAEKMPQLLPIADEQLQSFKSIFSTLRRIADETREKISSGQVVNEAEYRHFWDRIITAVFCAKTLDDGTSIEAVFERQLQSTRNVLCDLTSGLEVPEFSYTVNKLSSKVFNASSKFPSIGDIVEPAGPSTSRRLGTLDAVLQDAYQRSSKAATSSLRSHVIAREGELIASAGRWAENTGNLPQLQARVVDYHDFSICDGAVAAVVPDVFSAKESEHAKMFSPLKGFCDKPSEKAKVVEPEQPPDLQAQSEDNLAVFARRPIPTPLEATRAAKAEIRARIGERAGVPVSQSDDAQLHGSRLRQDDTPTIRSKLAQAASTSAALSLALEPPVPSDASTQGAPELQVKASSTVAQQQNPGSSGQRARGVEISLPIILVLLFLEYKRGLESPIQGINQAIHYLIDGVHNLNAAGIHDFPIFAIATVGAKGRLLAAWGEYVTISVGFEDRSVFVTRLADTNCPEWDISDRGELFRLALFLIHLRDIWSKRLVAKFDRRSFREEWTKMDFSKKKLSGRFAWRTADQKGEETYINLMQEIQRNMKDAEGRKKTLVEQVQKEKARATAEED